MLGKVKFQEFVKLESIGGLLLGITTLIALAMANSALAPYYELFLNVPMQVRIGELDIDKPLLLWINDGLMAVFFFLIGLELKRELLVGHLSDRKALILPGFAATGGMFVPALIYAAINYSDPVALRGWAIPAATDIAFALAVLGAFGTRLPASLKVFLLALAIMDDVGAIVIIALFYTDSVSATSLSWAGVFALGLLICNTLNVRRPSVYIVLGIFMWVSVLKSGIHATLAGVVLAAFIPLKKRDGHSMAEDLEHQLHPWVAFAILPLFAFVNAGVTMADTGGITHPVPLAIMLGLLIGKPIGVVGFTWIAVKMKLARLPEAATWMHVLGIAFLCGIGFTMSLFIGSLAFEGADTSYLKIDRIGILSGSLLSMIAGAGVLFYASRKAPTTPNDVKSSDSG